MRNIEIIIAALAVGFLLMIYPQKIEPRGIRNNNWLNIREDHRTDYDWVGEAIIDHDDQFEVFTAPEYGIRAAARILKNYRDLYGIQTVSGIINRWAPDSENNTAAYVDHVASVLGVGPDEFIDLDFQLPLLLQVMALHENGTLPGDAISVIEKGLELERTV